MSEEDNILPESEVVQKCDACGSEDIYACMGTSVLFVCRNCYKKVQAGELTLDNISDIRAGKASKITYA